MAASPAALFRAWTQQFDLWFAAPGSVIMDVGINKVFYFETDFEGKRHPHYGRFLKLQPNALVEITWLRWRRSALRPLVTVDLRPQGAGTLLCLVHAGFPNEESRDRHENAWPSVLKRLDECLAG